MSTSDCSSALDVRIPHKHQSHIDAQAEKIQILLENNVRLRVLLKEKGFEEPHSVEGDIFFITFETEYTIQLKFTGLIYLEFSYRNNDVE